MPSARRPHTDPLRPTVELDRVARSADLGPSGSPVIGRRALLALVPLAGLVAACGSDDGADAPTTTGGFTPDPSPTTVPATAGVVVGAATRRPATAEEAITAAAAMNGLGGRLYEQLVDRLLTPNLVFSPASVTVALAMTRAGARGVTADEMDTVLGVGAADGPTPADADALHRSMNALTAALESRTGTYQRDGEPVELVLALANAPWAQTGLTVETPFLDTLAAEYGAGLRVVDFVGDPEGSRGAINGWVADQTRERIPELIGQGAITPDTRMVLVNAVYLKAPWAREFKEFRTTDATFTTLDGDEVTVPMMSAEEFLDYAEGEGWRAVELPYIDGNLAMLLVLPDQEHTFAARIATGVLDEITGALERTDVLLRVPRFDIGTTASLRDLLVSLGMSTAFTDGADFSGITTDEPLAIAEVLHEANITIDEDGTEAAAATAVLMEATAAPPAEPIEITFDRPFLFAVRDRTTGAITFLGRIGDPSETRG